jgi:hypothetical protein
VAAAFCRRKTCCWIFCGQTTSTAA